MIRWGWVSACASSLILTIACGSSGSGTGSATGGAQSVAVGGGGTSASDGISGAGASVVQGGTAGVAGGDGSTSADEVVSEFECVDRWYVTLLDDDDIFYTCREAKGGAYPTATQFVLHRISGSSSEIVATSSQPLEALAVDADAYYVQEFAEFDDLHNTDRATIDRIVKGSMTLSPFVGIQDTQLVTQSADTFVGQVGHEIIAFAKTGGDSFPLDNGPAIFATTAWVDADTLFWANLDVPSGSPSLRSSPLAGGGATKVADLPNECAGFFHDGDALIAHCGKDWVKVTLDGQATPIATGVIESTPTDVITSDRIYWVSYSSDFTVETINALNGSRVTGRDFTLKLDRVLPLASAEYGYFYVIDGTKMTLSRFPLKSL